MPKVVAFRSTAEDILLIKSIKANADYVTREAIVSCGQHFSCVLTQSVQA